MNCTYWLAYSEYDKRFYKIGGFIENEIYLFLDHLSKSGEYETLFNLMTVDNFDIDDVIDYWSSDKKVGSPPRANTPLCDECDKAVKIY